MKRVLFLFVALACAGALFLPIANAAPVWGEPFSLIQPDGTYVNVVIWGDEYHQIVESPDGYTLMRDPDSNEICYAALSDNGQSLVSTGVRFNGATRTIPNLQHHIRITPDAARQEALAAKGRMIQNNLGGKSLMRKEPPHSGAVKGLCLIVDFSDSPGTITPSDVDNFCNQEGYNDNGNNGSVRDYFYDVSNGVLTYTNYVSPTYYRAKYNKSHYDDPTKPIGPGAVELIDEALASLDEAGLNFTQYDANGDGMMDALNCFYAGTTSCGWSCGLWPHSSVMATSYDGVNITQYQISPMGSNLQIGTFCHENGHQICWWPDLYDYDYDSEGVGMYCLMAYGDHGRNPVEPCAFLKYSVGWATVHDLSGSPQFGLTLTAGSNVICKFSNPSDEHEYYLFENRQRTGRDANLPDDGLAIWHVDELASNDWNQMTAERHYRVALIQADGLFDLENNRNTGDDSDLWKAPAYVACGPSTTPDTNWWNGKTSYLQVQNISESGETMSFDFHGPGLATDDTDNDGMSDLDETRDLNPQKAGIQNPFNPLDDDVTGNNGSNEPDGISDGENDYDGDGLSNAYEFKLNSNPIDASIGLPLTSGIGLLLSGFLIVMAFIFRLAETRRTSKAR
jgi:M6 family metalloprotease-like protein